MRISAIIPFLLFIFLPIVGMAQFGPSESYAIGLGKCVDSTLVKLRWAPINKKYWKRALSDGYSLRRMTISTPDSNYNGEQRFNSMITLDSVIVPKDSVGWGQELDSLSDQNVMLAYGTIWGDSLLIHLGNDGSFSSIRAIDEEEETRYNMSLLAAEMSFEAALASGLGFVDSIIQYGYEYMYLLTINNLDSNELKKMLIIKVETSAQIEISQPTILHGSGKGGSISIVWSGDPKEFITYEMERSDNLGLDFFKIDEEPIIPNPVNEDIPDRFLQGDTVSIENGIYTYRVRGRTVFGDYSEWSDTVQVVNEPAPISVQAYVDSLVMTGSGTINIHWSYPTNLEDFIQGFRILRSPDNYVFEDTISGLSLIDPEDRLFTDLTPVNSAYYKVQVEDIHGYVMDGWSSYIDIPDTIPPVKPFTPSGYADKSGNVYINWQANGDLDICCYRVYYSNIDTAAYHQITTEPVKDTAFTYFIDLETLQKETFVKIRAIDSRGNLSELSDPGTIGLPDIVPPSPPVITRSRALPSVNRLFFKPSASNDVSHYAIYRRPDVSSEWTEIGQSAHVIVSQIIYSDTIANSVQAYQYVIAAVDADENKGYSNIAMLLGPHQMRPAAEMVDIANVNGLGSQVTKKVGIIISWDYDVTNNPDLSGFKVYRSIDRQEYEQYAIYNKNEALGLYDDSYQGMNPQGMFHFIDHKVMHSRLHEYKVTAMFTDGTSSPLSTALSMIFYHN